MFVQVYSDCVSHPFTIRVHNEQLSPSSFGRLDSFAVVDCTRTFHQGTSYTLVDYLVTKLQSHLSTDVDGVNHSAARKI